MTDELAGLSAVALAKAIREGRISATEAVTAAIARAQTMNPSLNAVLSFDAEEALSQAKEIDSRASAKTGALLGVPLAHKDMFDRAGKIATWGAAIRAETPAPKDATAIARLKSAGAIGFAALNMAEFAFGITGHNYRVGHCRNPHDTARITGGSSSGSAAAVASGMTPFALGSDTGGSVRMPASCCGITGLRPTWGLISRAGAMPLSASLDTVGPLARDVADIALVLSLLAGADPADGAAGAPRADYVGALAQSVAGVRIGVDQALLESIDGEIAGLIRASLAALTEAGAVLVPVTAFDLARIDSYAKLLQLAEATSVHAHWMRTRPGDYSDQVRSRLEDGFAVSAVDYLQAQRARPLVTEEILAGPFTKADVLMLPVLDRSVPTIAETDVGGGANMGAVIGGLLKFTRPVGYLGLPSLALPTGKDRLGLPNGFQLVGRPYAEPLLLALGSAYQRVVGVPAPVFSPSQS